jgi:plastocyanin
LIGFGIALPTAIAYADLLRADPAAAAAYDYYVGVFDFSYVPSPLKIASVGQVIEWGFQDSRYTHSATDSTGVIDSGFKAPWNVYDETMPFSGTFNYYCAETTHSEHPMNGQVKVPMSASPASAPRGTTFQLGWSQISGLTTYSFDVQRKGPSDARWRTWFAATSDREASYTPNQTGTYAFRSRVRNTGSGEASAWSPVKKITVT